MQDLECASTILEAFIHKSFHQPVLNQKGEAFHTGNSLGHVKFRVHLGETYWIC